MAGRTGNCSYGIVAVETGTIGVDSPQSISSSDQHTKVSRLAAVTGQAIRAALTGRIAHQTTFFIIVAVVALRAVAEPAGCISLAV